MPPLIDTHAHLDDPRFAEDLPQVLERAREAGIVRVVAVATTAASCHEVLALAAKHPLLAPSAGLHPNHVAEAAADAWDQVVALASRPDVVALGETGLDRHWDFTPFAMQEDNFARHLELARRVHKPVIIHCREAEADVVRMLRADFDKHGPVHGVLHSFTGDWATAQAGLEMGLYVSFAGMLTYKNAQNIRDVAAKVPLDRLLVETDCPYLAPVPIRGQRNEPAHVVHTAACLAQVVNVPLQELAERTTANAIRLFSLTQ
jgi:TatD DNase family protein